MPARRRSLRSEYVSGNYFTTLGVNAFGGRVFSASDDAAAATPVLVLSHHAWRGVYGGDPSVVGATLIVEGRPFTVVGPTEPRQLLRRARRTRRLGTRRPPERRPARPARAEPREGSNGRPRRALRAGRLEHAARTSAGQRAQRWPNSARARMGGRAAR